MKKNDNVAIAGAAAAVTGIASSVPAVSSIATSLITAGAHTFVGTAVTVGAGIGGTLLSVLGSPLVIIGGIALFVLFSGDDK